MRCSYSLLVTDAKQLRQILAESPRNCALLWHSHCVSIKGRSDRNGRGEQAMVSAIEIDYPPEATLGDQRLRGAAAKIRMEPPPASPSTDELRREIARLAYELYLKHGRLPEHDLEDWLMAESIVCSRLARCENPVGDQNDGQEAE
jgi:DUF2934 family protein